MSLMASFCAVLFPRDVLDEIWDLIESVSEGFPSYSSRSWSIMNNTNYCKKTYWLRERFINFPNVFIVKEIYKLNRV